MSVGWVVAVVLGWTVLRLAEHVLSEVNTGALLARGALERCERQHLPLLLANAAVPLLAIAAVALHVRTQGVDAVFGAVSGVALGWLLAAESLHWWAILTLRRRWTTGVLVLPGETPSVRGPYRWLRHPGYVGGATSGALLPLVADSLAGRPRRRGAPGCGRRRPRALRGRRMGGGRRGRRARWLGHRVRCVWDPRQVPAADRCAGAVRGCAMGA